ncbi:hypothetical protein [Mycoplasma phage sp.]|uniref:Uncharacterized protein n=1 Tax=Mycoplasmopsis anatis 1340 TaxID=1034808 RepID=F9QDJ7_9BACT|nr:hypothetical protein [Mycoplasmopsis anatis]QRI43906.1 hypothetical protein [Mycoplasma phage sp.]AWX70391.1 hypothetical protein DP067_03480 [Mycoplasmopsis anatis]EGS29173.1 hypothetical protein GIG_02523 [Mycoplasmopsis anatis 1340]QRI43925.1 hypothetical protein [Mycoplasma phage sp.]QRI43960.1 hypothetical protein [Mycoplasma phage sp.]
MESRNKILRMNVLRVLTLKNSFIQKIRKISNEIPMKIILVGVGANYNNDVKNTYFYGVDDIQESKSDNDFVVEIKVRKSTKQVFINKIYNINSDDLYSVIDWDKQPISISKKDKDAILEKTKKIASEDEFMNNDISITKLSRM